MAEIIKVGITEAGDAGLDFSWVNKLYDVNIIISKHLTIKNSRLLEALVENQEKIIFHCTCTGYGDTILEPNVPFAIDVYDGLQKLIRKGFPVEQIVLRTDPIIPTVKGIRVVKNVWRLFENTGVKRCRYSVIDMYPHVKKRFLTSCGKLPFDSFQAPSYMLDMIREAVSNNHSYTFESCAENLPDQIGCVSKKDFEILGVDYNDLPTGFQRKKCLCASGKTELLSQKKRCSSGCLYCYWKD